MQTNGNKDLPEGAETGGVSAHGLPRWLAARINPAVLANRSAVVAKRLEDLATDRVLQRRAAEVVSNHLLECPR